MLCESCHKRDATCHVNYVAGETSKSRDLCNECFEAECPEAREQTADLLAARCQYCGGQPCAGGTDILALSTGVLRTKYMCMPCSMEHNRYVQEKLQQADSELPQQEQLAVLRALDIAADEHMKRWVSERGSQ